MSMDEQNYIMSEIDADEIVKSLRRLGASPKQLLDVKQPLMEGKIPRKLIEGHIMARRENKIGLMNFCTQIDAMLAKARTLTGPIVPEETEATASDSSANKEPRHEDMTRPELIATLAEKLDRESWRIFNGAGVIISDDGSLRYKRPIFKSSIESLIDGWYQNWITRDEMKQLVVELTKGKITRYALESKLAIMKRERMGS